LKLFSPSGNRAMMPGLNEIAKLCGFPGKLDISGQHVSDLWLAGELDKIVEYNQIDALNTYLVWLRVVYFCGKINDVQYDNEITAFREFLAAEIADGAKPHLQQFMDKWPEKVTLVEAQALSHHE